MFTALYVGMHTSFLSSPSTTMLQSVSRSTLQAISLLMVWSRALTYCIKHIIHISHICVYVYNCQHVSCYMPIVTLLTTRETLNSIVSWKLRVSRIQMRMGPQSYKFIILVSPWEYAIFAEKKGPAAAWKTSPSFIYGLKLLELHFCWAKGACGSSEDLTNAVKLR